MSGQVTVGSLGSLVPVAVRKAHADAETVAGFLRRTGYELPVALADLIDNSVDARATRVHIGLIFQGDRPAILVVADNGHGMNAEELERAVSLEKDPNKQDGRHLGRYGAGLKAASFSLGRVLTIATRRAGCPALGALLDHDRYSSQQYEYGVLSKEASAAILRMPWGGGTLGDSGTVLLISDLAAMVPKSNSSQDLFLETFGSELETRLGLIFHRYIESGRLTISTGRRTVEDIGAEFQVKAIDAVNPFGYPQSGHADYPKSLRIGTGQSEVPVVLHLWPKQGRTKDSRHRFYDILGRSGEWQGFYFYRWDRLLQTGGWNSIFSQEPHTSYARISVDLPEGSDNEFRPTMMKDKIENARPLLEVLTQMSDWSAYIRAARQVYRGHGDSPRRHEERDPAPAHSGPVFVPISSGPSIRLSPSGALEIDQGVVTKLGKRRAEAVGELVLQSLRPLMGRKRFNDEMKADLRRLDQAVRVLAGRRK